MHEALHVDEDGGERPWEEDPDQVLIARDRVVVTRQPGEVAALLLVLDGVRKQDEDSDRCQSDEYCLLRPLTEQ